ncbi:MAG: MlaD family protein [Planctomycetota bacterium]|nr:MlaD family protein [Planctomycetota bacterium]
MTRDFIVGVIFLTSLALIGALTFYLRQFPTGANVILEVGFENVGGLEAGDPVRIRGLRAGVVDKIELHEARGLALARIKLSQDLSPRTDHTFRVRPASALGGSYLHYDPGKGDLVPTDNLTGTAEGDVLGMVGKILDENRDSIKTGLERLDSLLTKLDDGQGIFGGLLTNESAKTRFLTTVENMETLTTGLREGEGILGSLLLEGSDQQVQLRSILTQIEVAMDDFSQGKGTVGMLFKDDEAQESVLSSIKRLDTITTKLVGTEGLAGTILNDSTFKQGWIDTVTNLKTASIQLRENGVGTISRLLHDEQLAMDLDTAVSSIASISESIQDGPGTLHSLINNPELYQDARETLTLLRDSTEDLREQEPVTAFFSILFAPF